MKALSKIYQWICKPHYILIKIPGLKKCSLEQKKTILFRKLVKSYADYDRTTGSVDIHPAIRARRTIISMVNEGSLNYYFDLMQLNKKHRAEFDSLNRKYGRKVS